MLKLVYWKYRMGFIVTITVTLLLIMTNFAHSQSVEVTDVPTATSTEAPTTSAPCLTWPIVLTETVVTTCPFTTIPTGEAVGSIDGRLWFEKGGVLPYDNTFNKRIDKPIMGATLSAFNNENDTSYTTQTDENGFYQFVGLPLGTYQIQVEVDLPTSGLPEKFGMPTTILNYDHIYFDDIHVLDNYSVNVPFRVTVSTIPTGVVTTTQQLVDLYYDYGDLPDSYSTMGEGAPFHMIESDGSRLTLGNYISSEPDGQPDHNALGEYNDDGVIPLPTTRLELDNNYTEVRYFEPGKMQRFEVIIIGVIPSEGAVLGMWLDWDHSGTFTEAEFFQFTTLYEGANLLPISVPDDYYYYSYLSVRVRLFAGDNLPGGQVDWTDFEGGAINGEVEDYIFFSRSEGVVNRANFEGEAINSVVEVPTAVSIQNISATAVLWIMPLIVISLIITTGWAIGHRAMQKRD